MKDKSRFSKEILHRHRVLTLVAERVMTIREASSQVGLSYRHSRRLFRRFLSGNRCLESLVYQRAHPAPHRLDVSIKKKVLSLYEAYPDLNNYHLSDMLEPMLGRRLHPSTIRSILIQAGCYQFGRRRPRRPRKRFEKDSFGELVQMDTSQHRWLPALGKDSFLVALQDDHSRGVLAARIFEKDTTYNNMSVIREAVEKYGIFQVLYTDNDSMFKLIRTGWSRHFEYRKDLERVQTEIHRALLELGITLLPHPPKQPQCKGKIERFFGFLQDRFVKQAKNCKDLKELNRALQRWIHWYNTKRVHSITNCVPKERFGSSVCRLLPKDLNLDDVFCFKLTRTVKNDNTFDFQGKTYQITNFLKRKTLAKAHIRLHILPDKCIRIFFEEQFIQQFPYNGCHPQGDIPLYY